MEESVIPHSGHDKSTAVRNESSVRSVNLIPGFSLFSSQVLSDLTFLEDPKKHTGGRNAICISLCKAGSFLKNNNRKHSFRPSFSRRNPAGSSRADETDRNTGFYRPARRISTCFCVRDVPFPCAVNNRWITNMLSLRFSRVSVTAMFENPAMNFDFVWIGAGSRS